jgi:hypothetical protein
MTKIVTTRRGKDPIYSTHAHTLLVTSFTIIYRDPHNVQRCIYGFYFALRMSLIIQADPRATP